MQNGDVEQFWLDPKLRFPMKWRGKNNSGELRTSRKARNQQPIRGTPGCK
jgi:hypothetical protein